MYGTIRGKILPFRPLEGTGRALHYIPGNICRCYIIQYTQYSFLYIFLIRHINSEFEHINIDEIGLILI